MGRSHAPLLGVLADQRNFVQHSLMSMRPVPGDTNQVSSEDTFLLQEACWTATAIYSLIAVFPISPPHAPFVHFAQQLKGYLINTSAHVSRRWQRPPQLVLWMTFMGAIASVAEDEDKHDVRAWYISVLERLVHRMDISTWEGLKEVLLNYLWFPNTSDNDGQQLWREINSSNPFT